ncbi:DUF6624 domain-containing protein [Thiohalomonas denitrificans]|uniref:Uncharacterized protein n=1 Tax=Thiohalomonas denitrificans TaxID=415747 RepID=A0A1G5Q9F1_9GAMM|nr:DUF6624 domain-containing protein [Thiohalomonas denitrificans]SCZ58495.1 hypothetical protein SAMN03097708_01725 [Thiohalomonas denitrificans]
MSDELRQELLSMQKDDQRLMRELMDAGELREEEYHPRLKWLHERHIARIKEIIAEHGWPGRSLVGQEGAKAAWLVVQHGVLDQEFMEGALPLLKVAVATGEAEGWCLAYLQDRTLTMAGKPQVYGTQHDFDENGVAYPLPMADPGKVDKLREEMGMGPLAQATKRIQEAYQPMIKNRDDG